MEPGEVCIKIEDCSRSSLLISSYTRAEFIAEELKGWAFCSYDTETRKKKLGQMYDIAVPPKKKK